MGNIFCPRKLDILDDYSSNILDNYPAYRYLYLRNISLIYIPKTYISNTRFPYNTHKAHFMC